MSVCRCVCLACQVAMILDEGPLGILHAYDWGACTCGMPADDEFYLSAADGGLGEDDGSGEYWLVHQACETRWYGGRGAVNDTTAWQDESSEPWKRRIYREIDGEAPAWTAGLRRAAFHEEARLIHTASGRPHAAAQCGGHAPEAPADAAA